MRFSIVAPCFWDDTSEMKRLMDSCSYLNLSLNYYGIKEDFINSRNGQIVKLIDFLKTLDDEIVLVTDGFDSWMLKPEEDILSRFLSFDCDMIMSAERDCYPLGDFGFIWPEASTSFRYPNAGQVIGYREKLIEALEYLKNHYKNLSMLEALRNNSQTLWQLGYLDNKFNMQLDHNCEIFFSAGQCSGLDMLINEEGIKVVETDTFPCSIHFNGPKSNSKMSEVYNIYLKYL